MAILETVNIEKHFGGLIANQDINIKIEEDPSPPLSDPMAPEKRPFLTF